jgi:TonB family protein
MFDMLIASAPHHQVRASWVTTSTITHALFIALAVSVTRSALENPPRITADPAILLFVPKPPPPTPEPEVKQHPVVSAAAVAEPPPKGFQTVVAPRDLPHVIPPVDLAQRPLDPRDFTGRGVEGGVANGVVGGTGVVNPNEGGDLNAIYEATTTDDRFEQAAVILLPAPRYPAVLEAAGIEGEVSVEFVIDTLGRVQPASIRILHSTHEAFASSVRTAMAAATFRPAHLSVHPVRQLTRQSIRFVATH